MKVLMINVVCGIGSTGRICTDIAKYLDARGHEVKIAYGRGKVPEEYKKFAHKIGSSFDTYLHCFKARILDNVGFNSKKATVEFISWIKEYNPDVIHIHNIHGYYINIKILFDYLKDSKKKVIWTLHDCWGFTGHCVYFEQVECDKWRTCCRDCIQKTQYPSRVGPDRSERNYQLKKTIFAGVKNLTLVTPSHWLKNLVSRSFLKEYKVDVIPNGVDTTVFHPVQSDIKKTYNCEDKKIVLGVASVWDQRKGLKSFIDLSQKLDSTYQIVLVGLKRNQINDFPDNIIAIERTNCVDDLVKLYTAADVFVNPTQEDNYPSTNIEALACGTPVVTYNVGGSVESAKLNGLVVEKNDIEGLKSAIDSISKIGKKKIDVSLEAMINKYMKLYGV